MSMEIGITFRELLDPLPPKGLTGVETPDRMPKKWLQR